MFHQIRIISHSLSYRYYSVIAKGYSWSACGRIWISTSNQPARGNLAIPMVIDFAFTKEELTTCRNTHVEFFNTVVYIYNAENIYFVCSTFDSPLLIQYSKARILYEKPQFTTGQITLLQFAKLSNKPPLIDLISWTVHSITRIT